MSSEIDLKNAPLYLLAAFGLVLVVVPAAAALVPVIVSAMRRQRLARFRNELMWYLRAVLVCAIAALVIAVAVALVAIAVSVWPDLKKTSEPAEQSGPEHPQYLVGDEEESANPGKCCENE